MPIDDIIMAAKKVQGGQIMADYMDKLRNCDEFFWINPGFVPPAADAAEEKSEQIVDIDDAEARLLRFAPFIERMFPEVDGGIIESPLAEITDAEEVAKLARSDQSLSRVRLFATP